MKPQTLTQSMSWLHTWGGLVLGWLLFAIFLTGTLAVFDKEIDQWMQPELQPVTVDQTQAAQAALGYLQRIAPDATAWNISLPTVRSPGLSASSGEGRRGGGQDLDPQTGEPLKARATAGGQYFFHFHYTLHLPRMIGIWVVGFAALAMLVALVSGIIIHKKFFKEFFTFRPAKGQRSWLDAHNASGVLLLPFHLMITYTGLVIFYLIYMPAGVQALYDGDAQAMFRDMRPEMAAQGGGGRGERERGPRDAPRERAPAAPMLPIAGFIAQAEAHYGAGMLGGLNISNPGRANAQVAISPLLGSRMELTKGERMLFDGVTGKVLQAPPVSRPSVLTQRVMSGLHFAQFGGYPMRWLYFVCGLVSSAMIATGLVLFTVKRRRRPDADGPVAARMYALAEPINIAVIAGLCIACVGMLWANRLLPVELAQRGDWEIRVFFALWLLSLAHAWLRPYKAAWREQLGLGAALCIGLPVLGAVTGGEGQTRLLLELTSVALGACLAWACWKVSRPVVEKVPRRAPRAAAAEVA
ncbi:PepSY domain-containing protein [Pseudomonas sp. PDM14]|uniref:PepSY-associated TM helix domain-containing protein n=1 Tax=Pseudomonas sp. PDM14 TaxID=2769288 RepID=UPI00177C8312|nr:PepSY-associated TM helix domain-containing protein [Pseudomonas sp. PDM14]MBD9482123.1 PepSY domain-containing protein [Pseudomonas sp. PDM14]